MLNDIVRRIHICLEKVNNGENVDDINFGIMTNKDIVEILLDNCSVSVVVYSIHKWLDIMKDAPININIVNQFEKLGVITEKNQKKILLRNRGKHQYFNNALFSWRPYCICGYL